MHERRWRVLLAVAFCCDTDPQRVCRKTIRALAFGLDLHEATVKSDMLALAEAGLIEDSPIRVPLGGTVTVVAKQMTPEGWLAASRAPRALLRSARRCAA